ncbi:hypothetical protein BG011_005164 [Mortierella polycephala]|uniref:histidine kinase n=1 Tax=Mortierella polycephala TaxID=41804 RepID=A0A9P6PY44_9FUNG|nr:hypothetical protein BG011_005164 [Mortierella polycephala]
MLKRNFNSADQHGDKDLAHQLLQTPKGTYGKHEVHSVTTRSAIESTCALQQQFNILHPTLSTSPVPSTATPAIYALASSVPFLAVNQLSMNDPSLQTVKEKVATPFKTILYSPSLTAQYSSSPPGAEESSTSSQLSLQSMELPTFSTIPERSNLTDENDTLGGTSGTTVSTAATTVVYDNEEPGVLESPGVSMDHIKNDGALPYFTSYEPVKRPTLPISDASLAIPKPELFLARDSDSFFALSPNSTKMPVHHPLYNHQHNSNYNARIAELSRKEKERDAAAAAAATATEGHNSAIGSRTTVFGFAPLDNNGDHRASMQLSEERVLRDGVVSHALPLDRLSRQANAHQSCGHGLEPNSGAMTTGLGSSSIPHARAGVSPDLNLSHIKGKVVRTDGVMEESMESLINSKDWSKTGLGPRANWPIELRVLVPMLVRSESPLAIYWGDEAHIIYNDVTLGRPGATVWNEVWDTIGSQMDQVKADGKGYGSRGLRFILYREGYEEECYFDFTFSPIFLENGSVGGIFANVQEVTQWTLNQRRLTTLNQFSKHASSVQSVDGAYSLITNILQESQNVDVPFSIVYKTLGPTKESDQEQPHCSFAPPSSIPTSANAHSQRDDQSSTAAPGDKKNERRAPQTAILCSTSFDRNLEVIHYGCDLKEKVFSKATSTRHIPDSLLITPEEYEPLDPSSLVCDDLWAWPVRSVLADGVPRLVTLPKSTHKFARALLLPILENPSVLDSRITMVLIVGINPFQMLDSQYLDFFTLLVANISSLIHFGCSREEERKNTEALFELNKTKILFFQNISHELRTPLTLMLSPLEDVLRQTPENAPIRSGLEMVRRNSRRLLKLVNTLLQFSRIEAGKGHAIFEETDLTKLTREISANFESVARGFDLDYDVNCEDLSGVPGGFWVDNSMWSGIILNLIGNAFKHTWKGSVSIHQYPCKGKNGADGVVVNVGDTGVGIAAEHLSTLFGRFNRIENKQSRSHEGTGIGLSLVKELADVHGGTISVTSEVEKGTCFRLWIPAGRSHLASSQVKVGDSKDPALLLRSSKSDILNNKTDASMFVEEASQWIAHKSIPQSTLTTSGTDSTEEDIPEVDDDAIQLSTEYLCSQSSVEDNQDYEVSALDPEESELTKFLIDSPESEDVFVPEASIDMTNESIHNRRSSPASQNAKITIVEHFNLTSNGELTPAIDSAAAIYDCNVNDNGCLGDDGRRQSTVEKQMNQDDIPPRTRSRRSYIIIVDDNHDMRAYLRDVLGRDFRVRCAVDGLDAIRLITAKLQKGKRIDLVLSDVAMPNMNGYELLKRLRGDCATRTTPFILLSARAGEEANVEGLDLGADDCLVKPFSARELLARVKSSIRLSDLRYELIREQRHAFEMKQLIYSISVRIRSGLSLPQILNTASRELFKVIRCNAIRICRFRKVDPESGRHWVRFVSEIVKAGKPTFLSTTDRPLPKGLEVSEQCVARGDHDPAGDLREVSNFQDPAYGPKNFLSVPLLYNRKIWGYLLASRDTDVADWLQSEKLLFEQTGNQISLAIAHATLWELKKSQQVEMETAHAANEAKSQILANTSHELRTPIGAIVGALSALEDTDQNLTGEQRDMVKIMQITSDVALSVINDLLDTAKLEAGAMTLAIKACPELADTLAQSVRIFGEKAGSKEMDLIMEPSDQVDQLESMLRQDSVIWTDGDRLQQVIMNLVGNAVKFTANGKVIIQTTFTKTESPEIAENMELEGQQAQQQEQQPGQSRSPRVHQAVQFPPDAEVSHLTLRFEVTDTGIGIDPDFLKNRIFKSFAQHDQSMTRRFGGTGLGLAISKHLVKMNGGILGVTSDVGQGATFYFTWPVIMVTMPRRSDSSCRPYGALTTPPNLSREIAIGARAIVIESSAESRHLLNWVLNKQDVQVRLYENCENVVQDEQNRNPDLLGPDGSVLRRNYRPNAHFFFCVRSTNAEAIVETARALGELFKDRNVQAKANDACAKDLILSIVLVIFSSAQGRARSKDMIRRILANGLENTVHCRYIVKPMKSERILECLQILEPYAPYTRGQTGDSPEITQTETFQNSSAPQNSQQLSINGYAVTHSMGFNREPNIVVDGRSILEAHDYEIDNTCDKDTPESPVLGNDGPIEHKAESSESAWCSDNKPPVGTPPRERNTSRHVPFKSKALTESQRRQQVKAAGDSEYRGARSPGAQSAVDPVKSSSDNPALSNQAARATAGKRERKGKCVLCVEDNEINLKLHKLGYDTRSACNGQVAVNIIKDQIEQLDKRFNTSSTNKNQASLETATAGTGGTGGVSDGEITMTPADVSKNVNTHPHNNGQPRVEVFDNTILYDSAVDGSVASSQAQQSSSTSDTAASSCSYDKEPMIDLILMDCAMPVKSGFDAASEIRAMGMTSSFAANIPIIALTASAVPSIKEKCLECGMNGYLSKPTKLEDLESMLNQWID